MSEQLLDGGDVGAVVEHVGRERMTENVWGELRCGGASFEGLMHYSVDETSVERSSVRADEEIGRPFGAGGLFAQVAIL